MTDILPPAGWPNVRQLETNEFAAGGANGNMNEQAKSLAARSELLKQYAALPYESKTGGYALNERVQIATGDIVRSTIPGNVKNPNVDMAGWKFDNDMSGWSLADNTVESIADLVAINNPKDGQVVKTKGYYPPIYGLLIPYSGGGDFVAILDGEMSADGCVVFPGNGSAQWARLTDGYLTASQAGCKEGDFDNTDLLNNAIASVSNHGIGELILDGFYKISKLEKGTTTTPFGNEPIYWLLKAQSNVTIKGRTWADGIILGGGLVASNANEAQTKGYCVFGDYNSSDIENFTITNFTIDNNGYENLLPAVNEHGSQALCPNMWFQRGKNINSYKVHYLDNPGRQTIVIDVGVDGSHVVDNKFTDNGRGLLGNNNIWDHSTIYCRAKNFFIYGNEGVTTDGRLPEINTFLEIHGEYGIVTGNIGRGYPAPIIRAAFFGQRSQGVKVFGNTFYDCTLTCEMDAGVGSTVIAEVYDNTFYLRGQQPLPNRQNVGSGHSEFSFAAVTPDSGNYSELYLLRNRIIQLPQEGEWTVSNNADNAPFRGGKINKVVSKGNTFVNFRGARQINYRNNAASYEFEDKFINCGTRALSDDRLKALFWHRNINAAWAGGQTAKVVSNDILEDCGYLRVNLYVGTAPKIGEHKVKSSSWITPFAGDVPDAATRARFNIECDKINESRPIGSASATCFGRIITADGQEFWKDAGTSRAWNMKRRYDALTAPGSPRFFGDVQGDIVENSAPSSGQPMGYVCTASSVDSVTAGVWNGYGLVV